MRVIKVVRFIRVIRVVRVNRIIRIIRIMRVIRVIRVTRTMQVTRVTTTHRQPTQEADTQKCGEAEKWYQKLALFYQVNNAVLKKDIKFASESKY